MADTETTVEVVTPWTVAEAVKDVTRYLGKANRFLVLGKDLVAAGATPAWVRATYGEGGRYWSEDWRGKRGERPSEHAIRETVMEYLHSEPAQAPRVTAQPKSVGALAEYARMRGVDGHRD